MPRIWYVGDIHGNLETLQEIDKASSLVEDPLIIVQVGDFGYSTFEHWLKERSKNKNVKEIYSCFGNHDNWDKVYDLWEQQGRKNVIELYPNSKCYYVHRTSVIDIFGISHLFLGGAESTNRHLLVEGKTWWNREQPSEEEFEKFFEEFMSKQPDTIVTHDAPLRVSFKRARRKSSITPNKLEKIYNLSDHQPRRHYFGHHHILEKWKIGMTKFYCCGLDGEYHERII